MPECSRMLQDTNAYLTPLQRQLNCQLNPHQTAKPRESLEEPLDLATCSTCALQGFSRHNIVVGQPLLPIFHNWKNHHNILQQGFGFLNVISSGLWWSTYGTFSKLTWPFWVQMGATWSYMEQHHLSKHIQTIWQCVKTLYPWWTSK